MAREKRPKKNRQRNGQKKTTKATTNPTKNRGEGVNTRASEWSAVPARLVAPVVLLLVTNPISHEWGKDQEALTRQVEHIRDHLWHRNS
jgi:hypothetical protein